MAQAGAELAGKTAKAIDNPPLEATTLEQYRQALDLHIVPFLGRTKLAKLSVPVSRAFADQLRTAGRSTTTVGALRVSARSDPYWAMHRNAGASSAIRFTKCAAGGAGISRTGSGVAPSYGRRRRADTRERSSASWKLPPDAIAYS